MALLPVYATAVLDLGSGGFGILLGAFGAGAVLSAVALPRLRAHASADAVVAAGSLVVAAVMLGLALTHSTALAVLLSVVGGAGWLCCLSSFNVASQQVVPNWVRARGLSFYLTFFMGGIALGSFAWGVVADRSDVQTAFAWGALAGRAHPVARDPVEAAVGGASRPHAHADVRPGDGPPTRAVGRPGVHHPDVPGSPRRGTGVPRRHAPPPKRARRATGATSWSVYRDTAHEHEFIETFVVPTWGEHLRQHARRTADDADLQEALRPFLVDGVLPHAHHYVAPDAAPIS